MKNKILLFSLFLISYFLIFNFVFAQQTQNPYSCSEPHPTLRLGSTGNCVRHLQWYLVQYFNDPQIIVNQGGNFGNYTESKLTDYQRQRGLAVDGVAGPNTWNNLHSYISFLTGAQPVAGQQQNQPPTQQQTQPQTRQLPGYNLPPLPGGTGLTEGEIQGLLVRFANFLIAAGVILAIITIVVSGLMYFWAGSDTEAKKAKGWFRNGIIGAIIILAVGVIILTIYNIVVNRTFFGGGVPSSAPGPAPANPVPGNWGSPCQNDSECTGGLECKGIGIFGTGPKTCQNP